MGEGERQEGLVSTIKLLVFCSQDITDTYKYPERTREERKTMEKALRESKSIFARYYLNDAFNDVQFDFELRDDIKIGQDFDVVSIFVIHKFMHLIHMALKSSWPNDKYSKLRP